MNLPLQRIPTSTSMINDKKLFFPLFTTRNIHRGYLLESHRQHMFLGVLNTVFLNISNYLPHLELWNRSIQIVVVMNFAIILNVSIKRFDCIVKTTFQLIQWLASAQNEYSKFRFKPKCTQDTPVSFGHSECNGVNSSMMKDFNP